MRGISMRVTSIVLIAAAAAVLAATPIAAQNPEAVVAAFHGALASGDSSQALALLAPDVLIYENGAVETSRDEYRSHHLPADMAFAASTTREVVAQSGGQSADVAWLTSSTLTKGTFRGREIDSRGTETMLLRQTPAGWRITHIHWSSRSN
jgi:ketosteroid isomerase-like protein